MIEKLVKRLPNKAKVIQEDGKEKGKITAALAVRHNPGDYYKVICRYKRNRYRFGVNSEGQIIKREVDESDQNLLDPFIVPKHLIERGKKRFWGSTWCSEMNEKLARAEKQNSLLIISMKKLGDNENVGDDNVDQNKQIEKAILEA